MSSLQNKIKLDILAIGAHPDDVEISASGSILKHIDMGMKVGILDLTRGEMGTRGSVEIRKEESKKAGELLGIHTRDTLEMSDSFLIINEENLRSIARIIRRYQPDIILTNAPKDRHPDHSIASQMTVQANFVAGLTKVVIEDNGQETQAWKAKNIFHYIQDDTLDPDFVIDISPYFDKKMKVLDCYTSQFYNPESNEPESSISSLDFYKYFEARARDMGRKIFTTYGEGFIAQRKLNVESFRSLY